MNKILRDILSRLERVSEVKRGWKARCPAHDDRSPSLLVSEGDMHPVTVHCFAGCRPEDVAKSLGFESIADLCENSSDLKQRVKRKEKKAPRPKVPDKSEADWEEMCRLYHVMTEAELWLRDQYRRRRAKAIHERDREAFDRWHRKWNELHEHVIDRERTAHRRVDRMDANTAHLEQS